MNKFVFKGQMLKDVVCTTRNVVIQKIQEGNKRERCYFIGNGHSLDVDERGRVIKHDPAMSVDEYNSSGDITIYLVYFTFECLGLKEASMDIANFVNDNLNEKYEDIYFIGHSKSGLCMYSATLYCKMDVYLVTISTPFQGTLIADKKAVQIKLKSRILRSLYDLIFSDHNVDRDIVPNSDFILNLGSKKCKYHINMISSLRRVGDCKDILDFLLKIVDKVLRINGDGIVPLYSQNIECDRTIKLFCSHANSLKIGIRYLEENVNR